MKRIGMYLLAFLIAWPVIAQDTREQVMEKRAREMHRILGLTDKSQWKKFIQENYSQAFINKPMRAKVEGGMNGSRQTSQNQQVTDPLEAKVEMLEQLHQDFGSSKIISIKPTGEMLEMVLDNNSGLSGLFSLSFEKNKPYLITGMRAEAGN